MRDCSYLNPRSPGTRHCTECGADISVCTCEPQLLGVLAEHRLHSLPGIFLREVYEDLRSKEHLEEGMYLSKLSVTLGEIHAAYLQGLPIPQINTLLIRLASDATTLAVENREDPDVDR